ncbi:DUF2079 domain-containing protein [Kitasatospora sp. NPDC057223]|uniref:DUF2079 domain-containing protein n=1 Tax=Kitasatospora sp. NPDC057223 TaxID=3346055 RepID=UPI003631A172
MTTTTVRPTWARPALAPGRRAQAIPHLALAAALFATYTLTSVLRYHRYGSPSWDLSIFTEAVKAYAHLHTPVVPIKGEGFNILGDHFSPVTTLLAPAWWIAPTPITLLVAQAALFAWSAGIISATAEQLLGRARGLCIGIAYGLSFGILRANDFEFHEIAFAVPLIAMVSRQLLLKRWTRTAWWALPLLLVKEDLGLTVATAGILIVVLGRKKLLGATLTVVALAAVAVTIWYVIPHYSPTHGYQYWDKIPGGTHPTWWHMATSAITRLPTWKTLGWTFGITGLLALRSPLALLAAPTLVWRLASANPGFWGTGAHYSATLMPVLFLAAADAAVRGRHSRRMWLRQYTDRAITALPAVAIACMAALNMGPGDLARGAAWDGGKVADARTAVTKLIPNGATVEATNAIGSHLAERTDLQWIGGSKTRPPDYVILDHSDWGEAPQGDAGVRYAQAVHPGTTYRVVFERDGITVVSRT